MFPQILVIAYNRPESLKRLLDSIAIAKFPDKNIELVISIDDSKNKAVKEVADLFEWRYGTKEIIVQNQRLGLKKHIYSACDRAASKREFIVLEDDISVSRFFYQFVVSSISFYKEDSNIAGISLYAYSISESCLLPFTPLEDEYDNCFIKFPSSWGQCFTIEQWNRFRKFKDEERNRDIFLPPYISDWKNNSWKKDFAAYMISENKYFAYPKFSLTTNFAERGTNFPFKMDIFQVPVQKIEKKYQFQNFQLSINKFDEYFELLPESLRKLLPEISDFDFAVDMYGAKEMSSIGEKLVLTTKESKMEIKKFGKKLSFQRNNIEQKIDVNNIVLTDKIDVSGKIRKPDFGARIFFHKNEKMSGSFPSYLRLFAYRIKFVLGNTLHWVKKYFAGSCLIISISLAA